MGKVTVLIVDDEEQTLKILSGDIERWGYACLMASSGAQAIDILEDNDVDLIISDHKMPGMDGLDLLGEVKERYGDVPFIMLTGYATIDRAVLSVKRGADDYLQKPYEPEDLRATIKRSLNYKMLSEENKRLRDQLQYDFSFHSVVSNSPRMKGVIALAEKVAASPDTTVAIYGPSGSGKEVLARAIHVGGPRAAYNFVAINCAGIPANLLESELFGYVKGAFTGADKDREGKFDMAQKGTILLDEIGDMPMDLQAKLLRVIEGRAYERIGANKLINADFRLIVATHRDLAEMVRKGTFREDLYHRINSFPIKMPALRERKEDIAPLVHHFLDHFREKLGKKLPGVSDEAIEVLKNYAWPGNIRELRNCLERAAILVDNEVIRPEHLIVSDIESHNSKTMSGANGRVYLNINVPEEEFSLDGIVDQVMRMALDKFDNNKSRAAEYLKINRSAFYSRKEY